MTETKRFCFVIMPFTPELHYFYLYMKHHIESRHGLQCERADARVLTIPVLEKINEFMQRADVVIADCSGRNANVFYELGWAHARGKQVILITHDPVEETPSDIRHLEFVKYDLEGDVAFFERLDNALHHVLFGIYEPFYQRAVEILHAFVRDASAAVDPASKEVFLARMRTAEQTRLLPPLEDVAELTELLLPRIIEDSSDAAIMSEVVAWISRQRSSSDS